MCGSSLNTEMIYAKVQQNELYINYADLMETIQLRNSDELPRILMLPTIKSGPSWEQANALAAVHEAGREIASSLDLDRTLRLVMQKAAETLPMDAGVLFVRDEASQCYRVAVSHNLPQSRWTPLPSLLMKGFPAGPCSIASP